jgi:hypothetical protein
MVGIATYYRMESMEFKSWWGQHFPHPSRPALEFPQPPVQIVLVPFMTVKWLRRMLDTRHQQPRMAFGRTEAGTNTIIHLFIRYDHSHQIKCLVSVLMTRGRQVKKPFMRVMCGKIKY